MDSKENRMTEIKKNIKIAKTGKDISAESYIQDIRFILSELNLEQEDNQNLRQPLEKFANPDNWASGSEWYGNGDPEYLAKSALNKSNTKNINAKSLDWKKLYESTYGIEHFLKLITITITNLDLLLEARGENRAETINYMREIAMMTKKLLQEAEFGLDKGR